MNEQKAWPTDLLTSAERRLTHLLADLDRWQSEGEDLDADWALNDTRDYVRSILGDVEAAANAADELERAAGRPRMTNEEEIADMSDRLGWGERR